MSSSSSLDRALTLHVLLPDKTEREFFVQHGITIGRTDANTICIDHPDVERIHARVCAQPDDSMVLECQTDNARVSLDGAVSLSRLPLTPGTRFQIGPARLTCGVRRARATAGAWQFRCPRCHAALDDMPQTAGACPQCALAIRYHGSSGSSEQNSPASFAGWLPQRVGPYVVRSFVAEGGMGIVLRGLHQERDRFAAVKLLRPGGDDDSRAEARFAEEVANLAKCVHPNLVRLQDSGADRRLIWLALDWVDGDSLRTYLDRLKANQKATSIKRVADWVAQISKGLAYLHERGIIHRDLKPGNIMVAADGLLKITDFGIAKAPLSGMTMMTRTGTLAGSAGYMSPEQSEGRQIGAATDIFSLGIVWYELLTRSRPLGSYHPARMRRPDCPPEWDDLIHRCLHFDPAQRPRLEEIARALQVRAKAPPERPAPPAPMPGERRSEGLGVPPMLHGQKRPYTLAWAAAAIVTICFPLYILYSFSRNDTSNNPTGYSRADETTSPDDADSMPLEVVDPPETSAVTGDNPSPEPPELDTRPVSSSSPSASMPPTPPAPPDLDAPPPSSPTASDRSITLAVVNLLRSDHLTRHPLDNDISRRTLKNFIKHLDSEKLYFYQSDIDAFMSRQDELDDQLKSGDTQFSHTVFNILLRRIDERVKTIDELLEAEHDFTVDEEMVTDPDAARHPRNAAEARDLWRKRIKYDQLMLLTAASATPAEDPRQRLRRRYHVYAKQMHQIDHQELLEIYLTNLAAAYDPHSKYMPPRTLENHNIELSLEMQAIGATLQIEDGVIVVKELIPGGPADKDGQLKLEDRIVGVGQGNDGVVVDTMDMKLSDVIDMIRGAPGTSVRLEVMPAGRQERVVYKIVRGKIILTDREARGQIIVRERDGKKYRVGAIDLPSFYRDLEAAERGEPEFKSAARDVARLLGEFRSKGVDCVVLDLRRNGGGSLIEGIAVTGLFLHGGPIVRVKDKNGDVQTYDDPEGVTEWNGPLVVLTSKLTASASEILAGAVQDYRRGIIIGDRTTHGVGTVQSHLDLGKQLFRVPNAPKMGLLSITAQQFYRPNGDSTQVRGVFSDVPLPSMSNVLKGLGEEYLDYALPFDKVEAAPHEALDHTGTMLIAKLNIASATRRVNSQGFKRVVRAIDRYQQRKNRRTITLNKVKFQAEQAAINADQEESRDDSCRAGWAVLDTDSYYDQEVLEITLDYLRTVSQSP